LFVAREIKIKMSNRAVVLQKFVPNNPEAGLALVTKPVPKAEPGQVVVRIILRPLNPTDLLSYRLEEYAHAKPGSFTPGSEGVGIVYDVRNSFHALPASFPLVALNISRLL
jgi:NADPH:quinone reductase-like Zn-dependent oxidoreductase